MGAIMKSDPPAMEYMNKALSANKKYTDVSLSLTGAAVLGYLAYCNFKNVTLKNLTGITVDAAFISIIVCLPITRANKFHIKDAVLQYNRDRAALNVGP